MLVQTPKTVSVHFRDLFERFCCRFFGRSCVATSAVGEVVVVFVCFWLKPQDCHGLLGEGVAGVSG